MPVPARGRPRRIEPADVILKASELIDRCGLDDFSMRLLADAMDVRPMAFYTYFEHKGALLDAVADRFLRAVDLPTCDGDRWDRWLVEFGVALRTAWTIHPHLLAVVVTRSGRGTAVAEMVDGFFGVLVSAGMTADLAHSAWHAVEGHVFGEVCLEAVWGSQAHSQRREPERRAAQVTDQARVSSVLAACDPAVEFRFGLELIAAGLRAHHPTAAASGGAPGADLTGQALD